MLLVAIAMRADFSRLSRRKAGCVRNIFSKSWTLRRRKRKLPHKRSGKLLASFAQHQRSKTQRKRLLRRSENNPGSWQLRERRAGQTTKESPVSGWKSQDFRSGETTMGEGESGPKKAVS